MSQHNSPPNTLKRFPTTSFPTARVRDLKAAKKAVIRAEQNAIQLRIEENYQKEAALQLNPTTDSRKKISILHNIRKSEKQLRTHQKLQIFKSTQGETALNRILLPTDPNVYPRECTEWRTVDDPVELETCLRERNQRHFGQAQGTLFTVPPISEQLNFSASTHTSDAILDGHYSPVDVDTTTKLLIRQFKRFEPSVAPSISSTITDHEFI